MKREVAYLELWIYRIVTYLNIPLAMLGNIWLIQKGYPIEKQIIPLFLLVFFFFGMHFKVRFFYWFSYLGLITALLMNGGLLKNSNHDISAVIFLINLCINVFFLVKWHGVKPLFKTKKQKSDELINSLTKSIETGSLPKVDNVDEAKSILPIIIAIMLFSVLANIFILDRMTANLAQFNKAEKSFVKAPRQTESVPVVQPKISQPQVTQPTVMLPQPQTIQPTVAPPQPQVQQQMVSDKDQAFYLAVQQQIPELQSLLSDNDFVQYVSQKEIDFAGNKGLTLIQYTGQNKDISLIPKIRALIDDYKKVKNSQIVQQPDIKIGFGCTLTDGRRIMVTKGYNDDYAYTAFGKTPGHVELSFFNTASKIQSNSLFHKNGTTLVMQNGTYQYHISGQGKRATIFVYNGDKGVGTYYCQDNQITWNLDALPRISVNSGSESHKRYCKQIINEGLYLAKMAKRCPVELSNLNVFVEDTAVFFDAEGCGYLIQGSDKNMKLMVKSLSDKLNASIEKKSQKLGSQFCAKEAGYANKMAERYLEFYNTQQ